jgi:hypothetical protein
MFFHSHRCGTRVFTCILKRSEVGNVGRARVSARVSAGDLNAQYATVRAEWLQRAGSTVARPSQMKIRMIGRKVMTTVAAVRSTAMTQKQTS